MAELLELMWRVSGVPDLHEGSGVDVKARQFIEKITFADADEILAALREITTQDWMAVPVWARNLAYRLAVLQRPGDGELLREASIDLFSFGPDWDDIAKQMGERADRILNEK